MQANNLGFVPYNLNTMAMMDKQTGSELCRITSEFSVVEDARQLHATLHTLIDSMQAMPQVLTTLQRLVEKIERLKVIVNAGGKMNKEDLTELLMMAFEGRQLIDIRHMYNTAIMAGYSIKKSDLKGFYFEDEFSADGNASEDFPTWTDAVEAAYKQATDRFTAQLLAA